MSTVRHRKQAGKPAISLKKNETSNSSKDNNVVMSFNKNVLLIPWNVLGCITMMYVGYKYAVYCSSLNETYLWFSNIKEVEREISFRTESGLYYSYYKQVVHASTFNEGLRSLVYDNITEHPSTINILARMNIYQEVFLAFLYRTVPFIKDSVEPIYFYINSVFALHGFLVSCLFALAWLLSKTWVAGLLTAIFYIVNKEDTTRVAFVIPLRESFSLPFYWSQLLVISLFFNAAKNSRIKTVLYYVALTFTTFLFSITWQFNQFILLLQAVAICALQISGILLRDKAKWIYLSHLISLILVCIVQFINTMILTGFHISFLLAALINLLVQRYLPKIRGVFSGLLISIFSIGHVIALAVGIHYFSKRLIPQEADEHIAKFLWAKFGFASSIDFDVQLYLCNEAFRFLPWSVIQRLTDKFLFPIYIVYHAASISAVCYTIVKSWWQAVEAKDKDNKAAIEDTNAEKNVNQSTEFPPFLTLDKAFHATNCCTSAFIAILTLRMKYLWTPYMCIMASVGIADVSIWSWLLKKIQWYSTIKVEIVRIVVVCCLIFISLNSALPSIHKELADLREFYDPDTVDLMEWIKQNTSKDASFTGSMQLLAGVKLCTGRPITNHPHYEDKQLRLRTKELYQIYAKQSAQHVHTVLKKYKANYIILEDSICLQVSPDGCGLTNILDNSLDVQNKNLPRFCQAVRFGKEPYSTFFRLVFENHTFRVYKVL